MFVPVPERQVRDGPCRRRRRSASRASRRRSPSGTPVGRRWSATRSRSPWPTRLTYRASAIANLTGLLAAIGLFALGLAVVVSAALTRRFTTPLRQLTDASRGPRRGRPVAARAGGPVAGRFDGARRARRPVQHDGRPARGERRDEPARPRPQPRLPGRRVARAAHPAGRPAHVQPAPPGVRPATIPRRGRSSWSRAPSRSSASTGSPRTCWSCRSSTRGSCSWTCGPTTCAPPSSRRRTSTTRAAARRGVRLHVDLPDAPIRIRHDPPRIGQVVANLVGNAVKFTPRGGIGARRRGEATDGRRADRCPRHGRRHRAGRAAPHLRALLPRLSGERGARQRQRPGPGHRQARSWTCTAARSAWRARPMAAAGSRWTCRETRARSRARRPPSGRTWRARPRGRSASPRPLRTVPPRRHAADGSPDAAAK